MLRLLLLAAALASTVASAATCPETPYDATIPASWLKAVQNEARQKGVSQTTLNSAAQYMMFNAKVITNDRGQRNLNKSFLEFAANAITRARLNQAINKVQNLKDERGQNLFAQLAEKYGVPPAVLASFWALESDFGAGLAKVNYNLLSAMTTLAYDCRRPEFFRDQLIDLLVIIDKQYVPVDVQGNWAGEIGGMQFIPSLYANYAVSYDSEIYGGSDAAPNLAGSVADTLASAANFLNATDETATSPWFASQPWLQQVRVPINDNFRWDQADINIQLPVEQWAKMGVTPIYAPFAAKQKAALLLPMGRLGPAFLAYPNFLNHYLDWNTSLTYTITAGAFANMIEAGLTGGKTPIVVVGNGQPDELTNDNIREVQQLLIARGENQVAPVDGKLGNATRSAVKKYQIQFGLPADSYPDAAFISKLRGAQ